MERFWSWWRESTLADPKANSAALNLADRDYRSLGPEHFRIRLDATANCALCVWYREERRSRFRRRRTDFCANRSPWWPNAPECYLYRMRVRPIEDGGWGCPNDD
jgi:hypothetical protein